MHYIGYAVGDSTKDFEKAFENIQRKITIDTKYKSLLVQGVEAELGIFKDNNKRFYYKKRIFRILKE